MSYSYFCVTLKDSGVKVENSWWIIQRVDTSADGAMPITYTEFYSERDERRLR